MSQHPVTRADVMDIAQYERMRPEFRARILAEKERRRVGVGEHFSFLFENHRTVLYQVQEMMRTERLVEEAAIAHEMRTYNELMPPPGGLAATLLIEYPDRAAREANLPKLVGLQNHVWLVVGHLAPLAAVFNQSQFEENRISSVQYLTFPLGEGHRAGWQDATAAGTLALKVDHPHYSHTAGIALKTAEALEQDFR